MSRRCSHRGDRSDGRARSSGHRPGVVRRVTRGLADKFGVPRKLVLAGFIVGLIMNLPLTVLLFLLALYWVDHPGRLEYHVNKASAFVRGAGAPRPPRAAGIDDAAPGPDLEFSDLRRQFDELERRAGRMENYVASDEYRLDHEIGRIRRGES